MNKQAGFTIFELTITLVISSILTLLAGGILNIGVKSYHQYSARSIMMREAQNTMIFLHDKIPMIIPESIIRTNSKRFRFITVDGEDIDLRYRSKPGILQYRIIGKKDWTTLLNNIAANSFNFEYSKIDHTPSHSVDEIKRISINFSLKIVNEAIHYENQYLIRN